MKHGAAGWLSLPSAFILRPSTFILAVVLLGALSALAGAAEPAPAGGAVTGLAAVHRDGQTFVTWKETPGRGDAEYAVYRSAKSFAGRRPEAGELVGVVRAGSAELRWEKSGEDSGHGLARAAIEDRDRGGRPLEPGTGLLVWTAKEEGKFFYCVLPRVPGQAEPGVLAAGTSATAEPVGERPAPPGAVQFAATGPAGWYFLQFGDFAEWSRDKVDDLWGGPMWSFHVAVPDDLKKGERPFGNAQGRERKDAERLPVRFALHGYAAQGARYAAAPALKDQRLIYVSPQDWQDSFWWGWARSIRPAGPEAWTPAKPDAVEPYAARRLSRIIEWAAASPANLGAAPDPERLYLYGHSTGGSGALNFVLSGRKGAERIAGVVATKFPISWPAGSAWDEKLRRVWGARDRHLPAAEAGGDVYQTVSPLALARRLATAPLPFEPPLLELSLGTEDELAPAAELPELAAALEKAKVPYFAHWGKYGHSGGRLSGAKNRAFDVRLTEPLLAFANASCNGKPGKDGDEKGWLNCALEWSSPANNFDAGKNGDDFVDAPEQCAFSVRLVTGGPMEYKSGDAEVKVSVDITPRRLAQFRPKPGTKLRWHVTFSDQADPKVMAKGEVVVDAHGLFTLPKVPVGKAGWGTRVMASPAP